MNKYFLFLFLLFLPILGRTEVLNNYTGIYATWWDADRLDDGAGFGISTDYRLLGIFFVEGNAAYVDFDQGWIVPLEASLNVKLPLPLTPYFGVGAGYYLADHDRVDSSWGTHMKLGGMFQLFGVGIFGEARFVDLEENALDGNTYLLGVNWKF